jgi:hypothetical protein
VKKTTALSVVLTLLIASPALARSHEHRPANPAASGYVDPPYAPPTYGNEVPWAPFGG